MSRLGAIFENSQRLAITAAEEAQRFGHPAVDVEHLFLALLVSQTDAGRLLRSRGIGLDEARTAVQDQHVERLSMLGIDGVRFPPGHVPADGPTQVEYNERANALFAESGGDISGMTLLRTLVSEPGGFVAGVVGRLGVDPDELVRSSQDVDPAGDEAASGQSVAPFAGRWVSYDAFVPASPERVWELLDDVRRHPEWDTAIVSIEPAGPDKWTARGPTSLPGLRWPIPRRARTRTIERIAREEPRLLEWRTSFPHMHRSRVERLRVELDAEPGGTRLHLALQRQHAPAGRFLASLELTRIASAISRFFRS
ncbi:SRPBCC family protein [Phytoactinopolyspora limicola]|uniref:SRPBCC family protein n=1 Tax=Phytoactinopolyspora limicola TaxID=2715536 RepID=UPI001407E849|nr:Clp protease N-terminal domain-containing protein [Phytoactinopolyspora limicola]